MGWFADLFKNKPLPGLRLEFDDAWEVSAPRKIPRFIRALAQVMPPDSIIYLEGTCTSPRIYRILEAMECEPRDQLAAGIIVPKPRCFHITMTEEHLDTIAGLFEKYGHVEICQHLHVYSDHKVLLEWHDAFCDYPFLLDKQISAKKLNSFATLIKSRYQKATSG